MGACAPQALWPRYSRDRKCRWRPRCRDWQARDLRFLPLEMGSWRWLYHSAGRDDRQETVVSDRERINLPGGLTTRHFPVRATRSFTIAIVGSARYGAGRRAEWHETEASRFWVVGLWGTALRRS